MVTSPRLFFIVASRCTSVQIGLGATPPQLPEWKSRSAWRTRNSNEAIPRGPNLMQGRPLSVDGAVGGDHQVGIGEKIAMGAHAVADMGAADLLLTL